MMGIMAMGCITEALGFTHHAVIEASDDSAGRRIWPGRARLPSCRPAAAATIYSCLPSPSICSRANRVPSGRSGATFDAAHRVALRSWSADYSSHCGAALGQLGAGFEDSGHTTALRIPFDSLPPGFPRGL